MVFVFVKTHLVIIWWLILFVMTLSMMSEDQPFANSEIQFLVKLVIEVEVFFLKLENLKTSIFYHSERRKTTWSLQLAKISIIKLRILTFKDDNFLGSFVTCMLYLILRSHFSKIWYWQNEQALNIPNSLGSFLNQCQVCERWSKYVNRLVYFLLGSHSRERKIALSANFTIDKEVRNIWNWGVTNWQHFFPELQHIHKDKPLLACSVHIHLEAW